MSTDKLVEQEFNRLRGRLLGLIESWGLPRDSGGEVREQGMKSTLKYLTYESQEKITELVKQ
jgi:hypothetical protein